MSLTTSILRSLTVFFVPPTDPIPFEFFRNLHSAVSGFILAHSDNDEIDKQWVKSKLCQILNKHKETIRLCGRRYGLQGQEMMIRIFLDRELCKTGIVLDDFHLDKFS